MTDKTAVRETDHTVRVRWPEGGDDGFLPWSAGQQGQQTFLSLRKDDDRLLLYAGVAGVMEADLQRDLMKLTSEGWEVQGELQLTFDGTAEPEMEALFGPDVCVLEIGAGLLPLVDPFQRAPLLEKVRDVRREIARSLGIIAPGVQVRDDLQLDPAAYCLRLRGVPVAQGQVFLDRLLAVGTLEQLAGLTGWTTQEPSYRLPAKWIEPAEREKAEAAQCMLLGGLAVLLTHLREALRENASRLLGLQETHHLLMRLRQSHPIVVEEFLASIGRVRKVRHVLQNLLAEDVPIRDLITILEVLGDRLERLDDVESSTEAVRHALAREILTRCADDEGCVRGLVLGDDAERRLREEPPPGPLEADGLARAVRDALEEHADVRVLFVDPQLRRAVRARLAAAFPHLAVVAVSDIVSGPRIEIAGSVKWKAEEAAAPAPAPEAPPPASEEAGGFWKSRKKK